MRIALGLLCWVAIFGIWHHANACEGVFVDLSIGKNTAISNSDTWNDAGGSGVVFQAVYKASISDRWDIGCQYIHASQLEAGPPFNDDGESSLDHVGCGFGFTY